MKNLNELTPPQRKIILMIEDGAKIIHINSHYANGGELRWDYNGTGVPSGMCVRGRPFWRAMSDFYGGHKAACLKYAEIVSKEKYN